VERIFGFELQFGPFAVAQLRLIAEMQSLVGNGSRKTMPTPKLFVTDTLGDPYATETQFSALVAPIGESRKEANRIKREVPITVVIGNPPYKDKAGDKVAGSSAGAMSPTDRRPEWPRHILQPPWTSGYRRRNGVSVSMPSI
jgi:predicted helicase